MHYGQLRMSESRSPGSEGKQNQREQVTPSTVRFLQGKSGTKNEGREGRMDKGMEGEKEGRREGRNQGKKISTMPPLTWNPRSTCEKLASHRN